MSTNQPKRRFVPGDPKRVNRPKPETRLTFDELITLQVVVQADLRQFWGPSSNEEIERQRQKMQTLLTKLQDMTLEAYDKARK